jgi:hypothetical protein
MLQLLGSDAAKVGEQPEKQPEKKKKKEKAK